MIKLTMTHFSKECVCKNRNQIILCSIFYTLILLKHGQRTISKFMNSLSLLGEIYEILLNTKK